MNAEAKYNQNKAEIETLMSKLQAALALHQQGFNKDSGNWSFVGDLGMIKDELKTVLDFIN